MEINLFKNFNSKKNSRFNNLELLEIKNSIFQGYVKIILTKEVMVHSCVEGNGQRKNLPAGFTGKIIEILKINNHRTKVILRVFDNPAISYIIYLTNDNFRIIN